MSDEHPTRTAAADLKIEGAPETTPINVSQAWASTGPFSAVNMNITDTLTFTPKLYTCPAHGDVSDVITVWKGGKVVRSWCGECYTAMLDAHCRVVQPKE